jgi:hypothetical protein
MTTLALVLGPLMIFSALVMASMGLTGMSVWEAMRSVAIALFLVLLIMAGTAAIGLGIWRATTG